jgi:hypothetical protein
MFPKVYRTIHTPAVAAIVGDRISRHSEIAQTETRPYITWQIVTGQPYDNLSDTPCGDFTIVQFDAYHLTDAGAEQLGIAIRAALDASLICNRVVIDNRDPETKLYHVGIEADFIDQR